MFELAIAVITVAVNLSLGLIAFVRNVRSVSGRVFFLASVSISTWAVAIYLSDNAGQLAVTDFATRLAYPAAFMSALTLAYFSFTFPKERFERRGMIILGWLFFLLAVAGSALSVTDYVIGNITPGENSTAVAGGPFYWEYLLVIVLILLVIVVNFIRSGRDKGLSKPAHAQVKFVSLGLYVAFALAVVSNGILPMVNTDWDSAKLGPFFAIILNAAVTTAMVRHRLFDIRLVVARSIAYLLLLATLAGLYAAAIFGISQLFFQDATVGTAQNVTYIGIAIVLAFTFQPLRAFFEHITDRVFYRDRYDTQEVLNAMGKIFASEIVLDQLLDKMLAELCASLNLATAQVMLVKNRKITHVAHCGPLPDKLMTVPELGKFGRPLIVADELSSGERKEILDRHGLRVSLLLRTKEGFIGFLLLGDKKSGDIYSNQDLRFLEILAQDLSIGIQNAKAYAEIQAFSRTLQERVDRATAKLKIANKNLKDLDTAKDEFISMASHQLRTPLTTIKGYLSMLVEGDAGPTTPRQQEFLGYTYDGAQRMVSLIADLLNVSRMSAGRFVIERNDVDFVAMATDEVARLQSHAKVKKLSLTISSSITRLPASIDEGKTRQVIMNYIDNAIYYTNQGGITVKVTRVGDKVRLTVTDTGIGVPDVAKAKLFSKFYRADNAQAARPDGTGLGLFMAKRVIEDQGGTIIFDSTEGKGSTFGFELPLIPQ